MKRYILVFTLALLVAVGRAALPQPDLIAQIHFAGAEKNFAPTNTVAFTNEFCSAEAVALRAQTADKLSAWLAGWLPANGASPVAGGAAKLRPLFNDLQRAEWWLEARAPVGGRPDLAIAIRLDAARAKLWQANLQPFFPAATFKSVAGWLIFDAGTGPQKVADTLAAKLSAPAIGWGSVDVNWPRLAQWYPALKELGLPETQLTLTAPDANLRLTGKLFYPDNFYAALPAWQMPTNTVHPPFVSFTAVRGISAWLAAQTWAAPLLIAPVPDQAFVWAMPKIPFQTFVALPFPDATAALNDAYGKLLPLFAGPDATKHFLMPFAPVQANGQLNLRGVPFMTPYLQALKEASGQYLLEGTFPNTPVAEPLPAQLFTRLATKDLVYYHWENTADRFGHKLEQLPQFAQLVLMMTRCQQLAGASAGFHWLKQVGPALGFSVTEITRTGPAELTFTRKSAGLFTAMEMFVLANWLEAATFPRCDLRLPATAAAAVPNARATVAVPVSEPAPTH